MVHFHGVRISVKGTMATTGLKDLTNANPTLTMFLPLKNVRSTFPVWFLHDENWARCNYVVGKKKLFMSVFVSCYPTKLLSLMHKEKWM